MKNKLLLTMFALLISNFVEIHAMENPPPGIVRINGIHIDEVLEGGDEGAGATIEFVTIFDQTEYFYQTFGFEFGFITSEVAGSGFIADYGFAELIEFDTRIIPFFANYTIGSYLGDSGFFVEAGAGIGIIYVDFDLGIESGSESFSESDDDTAWGGQFLGRFGYKFAETAQLSFGIRYVISGEGKLKGDDFFAEGGLLDTVAFDAGLSFVF